MCTYMEWKLRLGVCDQDYQVRTQRLAQNLGVLAFISSASCVEGEMLYSTEDREAPSSGGESDCLSSTLGLYSPGTHCLLKSSELLRPSGTHFSLL